MNASNLKSTEAQEANIIPLVSPATPRPKREAAHHRQRFTVQDFTNATDTKSYRVTGYKRDGTRVRENFAEVNAAKCRQVELETEYLRGHTETNIRATKMSAEQVQLAEVAYIKLGDDWQRILDAVDYWLTHGRQMAVAESPRLDDAFAQFSAWLENGCELRDLSRKNLRRRVNVFVNSVANMRVADVTPETIDGYLAKRTKLSPKSKDNDRRAASRFLSWCIERPRRWAAMNPCREVKIQQREDAPPAILTVKECEAMLNAAKPAGLVTYVAVCLFGGLRPFEAQRLTWEAVNLADGEIRLEGIQTKTGKSRVVSICPTLRAWLEAYKGKPFFPSNWRKDFDAVKQSAGYGGRVDGEDKLKPWPVDVMRHTGISHYFRHTGSYGQTAEQFGNSEAIIKKHYAARVSSEDTKAFYALLPKKGGRK
jgi:integrase